jgi:hypothetical protein
MDDPNFESALLIIKERDAIIDRLRAALKKIADDEFDPADWDGKGQAWTNVAQRALEQEATK